MAASTNTPPSNTLTPRTTGTSSRDQETKAAFPWLLPLQARATKPELGYAPLEFM